VTNASLWNLTKQFVTNGGVAYPLCAKLDAAQAAAARGDTKAKAGELNAYKNEVAAQSSKTLTSDQAATLTRLANTL
jgi:hypothetical protein